MPPEDNPADETPIAQAEYESGERALLTQAPWTLEEFKPAADDFAIAAIRSAAGRDIARVYTRRSDAMVMRASAEWWEALCDIAFADANVEATELRQLARNALGKR